MSLRGCLLLSLAWTCCQSARVRVGCAVTIVNLDVHLHCINITEYSDMENTVDILNGRNKVITRLSIERSPQFTLKREDLDKPEFEMLETLNLRENGLTIFNSEAIVGLKQLAHLTLPYNNLTSVGNDTFLGLVNIAKLNLNNNQIATIDVAAFKHFKNLTQLNLRFNKLTTISPGLFEGLNLKHLSLSNNLLTTIENSYFRGLEMLVHLELEDNKIGCIDYNAFQSLPDMALLELQRNQLECLDSELFDENELLVSLDLGGNNLENITNFPIKSASLKWLKLSSCNIHDIPADYFKLVPNLTSLHLNKNKINEIKADLISSLTKLQSLNLNGNELTSLSVDSFTQMYPILREKSRHVDSAMADKYVLNLDNNPWNCTSSDMSELREWFQHGDLYRSDEHPIVFEQVFDCDHSKQTVPEAKPGITQFQQFLNPRPKQPGN